MAPVFEALAQRGIVPEAPVAGEPDPTAGHELRDRVVRRAAELIAMWNAEKEQHAVRGMELAQEGASAPN
jgi:hypothetical protein